MQRPLRSLESESRTQPPAAPAVGAGGSDAGTQPSSDQRQAQIARLFELTSDLLATISLDGRFTLLNPAWEDVLGWKREELLARPMQELMHPDDVEQTLTLMLAGSRH